MLALTQAELVELALGVDMGPYIATWTHYRPTDVYAQLLFRLKPGRKHSWYPPQRFKFNGDEWFTCVRNKAVYAQSSSRGHL